jgi:hypothetical protein
MDEPLTEQDFGDRIFMSESEWERAMDIKEKVQSAKRLLKQRIWERWYDEGLQTDFNEEIDACFQIPDGDDKK